MMQCLRALLGRHIGYLMPIKKDVPEDNKRSLGSSPFVGREVWRRKDRAGVLVLHFMHRRGKPCGDQHTQQGGKKPGPRKAHNEVARDDRLGLVAAGSVCGIAIAAIKSGTLAVLTPAGTAVMRAAEASARRAGACKPGALRAICTCSHSRFYH